MPADVYGNRLRVHSVPVLTSITLAAALLIPWTTGHAQPLAAPVTALASDEAAAIRLPAFGNTPAQDRLMLREIGDQYVVNLQDRLPRTAVPTVAGYGNESQVAVNRGLDTQSVDTVWQFVQQSRRLQIPDDNEAINDYRKQYQREAMWITQILERATPFVGHIVDALDARYLPVELALLPAIESGYQPDVISLEQAAGLWQIIPLTAHEIGIERNQWFDGRADIVESTVAAIDYLSYLNAEFHGDWLLTLAAYNAGLGRVHSAIKRNAKQGEPTDFWSLKLPRETRNYVPKFLALVAMLREDSLPDLNIPLVARGSGFEILDFDQRTSLDQVARISGLRNRSLRRLNAALVHGVTPPDGPHQLYVGKAEVEQVIDALAANSSTGRMDLFAPPDMHKVISGDTISSIARRYGITQRELMAMNELEDSKIRIGQTLILNSQKSKDPNQIQYVVTIGDTLSDIARRFSVQVTHIRNAEGNVPVSDVIHPGERLSILVQPDISG